MNKLKPLNLPRGEHDDVLLGELREMVETWSAVAVELDAHVMEVYGREAGRSIADVVPTLAYAHIAKAAFGLSAAADSTTADFDTVEFGNRCAAIAREQMQRYSEHREQ